MKDKSPDWRALFKDNTQDLSEIMVTSSMLNIKKANSEYLHWNKFRYNKTLHGDLSPELAWTLVKILRTSTQEKLPLLDENNNSFTHNINKQHLRQLSYIDSQTSGTLFTDTPLSPESKMFALNGLMEEAISSSQIEGANTTRKAAQIMLKANTPPRNKSDQMILNNYKAMSTLEDWTTRELSNEFILDLHKILTSGTLEKSHDEGRFRKDQDNIVIQDSATGEVTHTPPKISAALAMLRQVYSFANKEEGNPNDYIHPFVKASILHFMIGYIHPFIDGNGRLARAIFYWYLLKKDYWMFKYLPISLQIKKKEWRPRYYKAFENVESDEGDLTYFISYKLKLTCNAIQDFEKYLIKKQKKEQSLKERISSPQNINSRQLDTIEIIRSHPSIKIEIETHRSRHNIAYQTARTDLLNLVSRGILKQENIGKKYVFYAGKNFPHKV